MTGAAVRWLREGARIIDRDEELGELAATVPDAGGLVFVPAFTGLNVPYDVREARGSLLGMTLGHTRAHIARAFLDSIGFQLHAILAEIQRATGVSVTELKVGGGLSASDAACAIQADWLGIPVLRSSFGETTARAAALLAGIGAGRLGRRGRPAADAGNRPALRAAHRRRTTRRGPRVLAACRGRGDRLGAPEVEIGPDDRGLEGTAPLGARRGHVARLPRAHRGAAPSRGLARVRRRSPTTRPAARR